MSYIYYDDVEGYPTTGSTSISASSSATITATNFKTACGIEICNDGTTDLYYAFDARAYTGGTVKAGEKHFEPMTFHSVVITNASGTTAGSYRVRIGTQTIAKKFN